MAQLGDGSTTNRNAPTHVDPASRWQSGGTGATHTLAVQANGTLWAWGNNGDGKLGDGLASYSAVPLLIYGTVPLATQPPSVTSAPLQVVPNPAHDYVRLPELAPGATVRLLDVTGRCVRTGSGSLLVLTGVAPGLYLLQATLPTQAVHTARLLVD
ncbi:MAG: hypothetical protein EOO63_05365 [Hymenobacter sp.]|nr:MAG: hypothetical protein EOO63_05365 [Hymenobacter sp.]